MNTINAILVFLFKILFFPFRHLAPFWGLLFVSVLTGVLMLLIFKRISNQEAIRRTKNRIKAHLLEMRLYKDDMRISFRVMMSILLNNLMYLTHALKPMLVLMIPVLIILIHTGTRYNQRPLQVGESVIVTAALQQDSNAENVRLIVPENVLIEIPPLYIPSENTIYWRIRAIEEGPGKLRIQSGEQISVKELVVGRTNKIFSSSRVRGQIIAGFLYPAEKVLPSSSSIRNITVRYPQNSIQVGKWHFNWLVLFFVFSMAVGFTLKGVFKVEI
jgi:uncharacterized membrane protein (DUF106 family)